MYSVSAKPVFRSHAFRYQNLIRLHGSILQHDRIKKGCG